MAWAGCAVEDGLQGVCHGTGSRATSYLATPICYPRGLRHDILNRHLLQSSATFSVKGLWCDKRGCETSLGGLELIATH